MPENNAVAATNGPSSSPSSVAVQVKGEAPERSDNKSMAVNDGSKDEMRMSESRELTPPPLPPRPLLPTTGSLRLSKRASRPQLLSNPTTALSLADVHTQNFNETGSLHSSPVSGTISRKQSLSHFGRLVSSNASEAGDTTSLHSYAPALFGSQTDLESLHDEAAGNGDPPAWEPLNESAVDDAIATELNINLADDTLEEQMEHEFDRIEALDATGSNEDTILAAWRSKLKHFFILSASGKPIYSRHGDDRLTGHYIGMIQTLLSFYESSDDSLKAFFAGSTRFAILSKGPLNLVATSRLGESEAQLRNQLESLYMQILSTLTLPSLERIFSNRPSTDLRRPLQGTDALLDGLADGFTRGSPSTLLSALECLRLRKTERKAINDAFLKARSPDLLYGLIVAAGRLVSVVRPKKHSLHPGDLHLIFNMLFEASSVKAAGGENWIPLCLPGFNKTGFLYMYVSFFQPPLSSPADIDDEIAYQAPSSTPSSPDPSNDLAIILITANKESFYTLQQMRDSLLAHLTQTSTLAILQSAMTAGRPRCTDILPSSPLRHFLYRSRANVQFVMPSFAPDFEEPAPRRALMSVYAKLHEALHTRTSSASSSSGGGGGAKLNTVHVLAANVAALAWETPLFEIYCVAAPSVDRQALVVAANRAVQWARREEERVFIIGGAVF